MYSTCTLYEGYSCVTCVLARVYLGLFHLVKLPCLNSLTSHLPETLDLAFKLRRKRFSIEVSSIILCTCIYIATATMYLHTKVVNLR